MCGGDVMQRDDDTPESVNRRLDLYEEQTFPLIRHYGDQNRLPSSTVSAIPTRCSSGWSRPSNRIGADPVTVGDSERDPSNGSGNDPRTETHDDPQDYGSLPSAVPGSATLVFDGY